MAQYVYPKFKENCMEGNIDVTSDTINIALLDAGYSYSAADEFWTTSGASAEVLTNGTVEMTGGITATNGEFTATAASHTFTAVNDADPGTQLALYVVGAAGTADYLIYLDEDVTGLPLTVTGGDVVITWDTVPSYIFKI